jgi:hypothetical protein
MYLYVSLSLSLNLSPFSYVLLTLAAEVVDGQQTPMPKWLFNGMASIGLAFIRKTIKKKALFDIRYRNSPSSRGRLM